MSPAMVMTSSGQTRKDGTHDSLEISQYQKGVKHMYENGIAHVPKKYILPDAERPNVITDKSTASPPDQINIKLPVIDFEELQGPNRSQVLKSLAYACENYGFFQLVNHGMEEEIINNMVNVGKRFFEMPLSEREKYMSADVSAPVRCGTSFNQKNDGVFCWRDFLKLVCHPMPDVLSHWPSSPHDFREMAVTYAEGTRFLFLMLVEATLESLGLKNREKKTESLLNDVDADEDAILKELEDGSQQMVVNYYPPCPQPDLTLGLPPHSDYGFLTLLLQDDVKGLQIQHQDNWVTVQPIPGSFVVNVGDHLEIFSNGRYKSVLHRVFVNSVKCRISVASLHTFPFTSTVRPSAKLVSETNPRRYKDTDFASFLEYIKSCDCKKKNFLESRKLS
ncbi:UNVERIFIED_CONTAM: putative 2-oxoglutarate-dependent dioxygenase SLC1 [Sesamum calycinum]|uniref:2-oxoglutarate-dependent dioxygenase SLC1 n=1 Tax=Sesamum calycinum TaxID=2727403 RepID=A0AAW2J3S5_9LAMI